MDKRNYGVVVRAEIMAYYILARIKSLRAIELNPQSTLARYLKGHCSQSIRQDLQSDAALAKARELGYPV